MPITINGSGTITGASTLATTVASPTFTTPNIDSAQFATVAGTAPIYPCRAWVNFNGSGVVGIRASGNVTSLTDNGTGLYAINFTTAMTDVNYSVVGSAYLNTGGTNYSCAFVLANSVSSVTIQLINSGATTTAGDSANVYAAVFR